MIYKRREQGTPEQGTDKKKKLHQFKAQSKKRCFYKMRSPKKTVSLFQSHVFKHEFFLFRCSLFPLNIVFKTDCLGMWMKLPTSFVGCIFQHTPLLFSELRT
jgi:hypothetical protein